MFLIFTYFIKFPINFSYGFYTECRNKISVKVWKAFQKAFNQLPLCARISKRILAMHGGISPDIKNWSSLENLKVLFNDKRF